MAIRGKTAELLVRLNPALYRPYIWCMKKGVPMLYVSIEKVLCGMLRAALLFYRKLRADLEDMGFKILSLDHFCSPISQFCEKIQKKSNSIPFGPQN